jgi:uncharacterized protein YndB with AHSA1/START domain
VRVRRARRVAAPLEKVWSVASDPYRLPRWWPRTERVEAVSERGWTSVLVTERGRSVRADYTVIESTPPTLRRWSLDVEGSPFANLLADEETELRLRADGDGTEVALAIRQAPRGWARVGVIVLRRAAKRTLDDALTALDETVSEGTSAGRSVPAESQGADADRSAGGRS